MGKIAHIWKLFITLLPIVTALLYLVVYLINKKKDYKN